MSRGMAPRASRDTDLYARAGLPQARYATSKASPTADRSSYDARIGSIVHGVIATVARTCQLLGFVERGDVVQEAVAAQTLGRDLGRGDKARLRVTGLVCQYLDLYLPPADATFVGAELRLENGRVDLAWKHPKHGVFFDELKTWRHDKDALDADTLAQMERYLDAGSTRYSERFSGVRLITLGNRRAALWLRPDGQIDALAGSALDLSSPVRNPNPEVA
ncbi:hypothetical protein IEQ44_11540 [Nocardioides sp. Y6]|uniref:Uncharacterized protein n=1 Tax=Nocardioides malaquae TaxID=2773426 RepID=A0ABR9RUQ6_9ACTN|nr:hypothetical protein [Nocardioides malaquae]MBE7325287.1 hypothetical protein [Nocardioides malaquae]